MNYYFILILEMDFDENCATFTLRAVPLPTGGYNGANQDIALYPYDKGAICL